MSAPGVLPQIGGLLFFVALVAVLFGGHRLYSRVRAALVLRDASRPVPGRMRPVDAAYLEQTAEWLRSLRPPPGRGAAR